MDKEITSSNAMYANEAYSSTCCVGSKASIDIDSDDDGFYSSNDVMLLSLCMKVDSALVDILSPPTSAPTAQHSSSPTIMATTISPTTDLPTVTPSESPSTL